MRAAVKFLGALGVMLMLLGGMLRPTPVWSADADLRRRVAEAPLGDFRTDGSLAAWNGWMRSIYFSPELIRALLEREWKAFLAGDEAAGPQALGHVYVWWRLAEARDDRIRIARIGQKMAEEVRARLPKHPAGHLWGAVYLGTETLSRGLLDALYLIPEFRANLAAAVAIDPDYYYGTGHMLEAKLYIKLPPRPLSLGDADRGREILEKSAARQRSRYAYWHLFMAELELQRSGIAGARAILDRIAGDVKPVDVTTAWAKETSLVDAERLLTAVADGSYNKYTWDAQLFPARPWDGPGR
jgi:hypothetical protein